VKPLNCHLPKWAVDIVESTSCIHCKRKAARNDIVAIGIREINSKSKNCSLYVEHQCLKCGKRKITSFGGHVSASLEDLCYILLERTHKNRQLEASARRSKIKKSRRGRVSRSIKNRITRQELDDMKKFLKQSDTHDDFLKYITPKKENEN